MATHIQIGDVSPRIQYTADGAQTGYTYPFPIFTDADIEVYEDSTLKTLTTDYTVTGAGNSSGGTVTLNTAPAAAVVVTLRRKLAIGRTTDFQESGEFRAKVINDELDYQTAVLQQLNDDLGRGLRLADTDPAAVLTLPDIAARAGKYLGFDASGLPVATDAAGPTGPTGLQGPAGNMDGSNNLSELTVPATARANLGLVIGTDVLSPTGDGSGLSGIVSGATVAEKANIMLNAFRIAVNGGLSVLSMVDGAVDEFTDQTGVDTAISTNETHDAAGGYYHNPGADTIIAGGIPTMQYGGTAADINDNNAATTATTNALANLSTSSIALRVLAEIDFGATRTITKIEAKGLLKSSSDTTNDQVGLYYWDGTAWQILGAVIDVGTGAADYTRTGNVSGSKIAVIQEAGMNLANYTVTLADLNGYGPGTAPDMTLVSNAAAALAQPDSVFVVLRQEDVDAAVPNTDLTFEASRDGGTTWTAVVLAEVMTDGAVRILTGNGDISAQPVGTSMKWRVKTLNNKSQKIHAVGLEWS